MTEPRITVGRCVSGRGMVLSFLLVASGCATAWRTEGSFYRTAQTEIDVRSPPGAAVYVDNKYTGQTPLQAAVQYQQQVVRKTRRVSYWQNQPGWSLLLSILSLGVYIPFGLIPVTQETALEPQRSFTQNSFVVEVAAEGHEPWKQEVVCNGEERIPLQPILNRKDSKAGENDGE
jgi:hypothetical protein